MKTIIFALVSLTFSSPIMAAPVNEVCQILNPMISNEICYRITCSENDKTIKVCTRLGDQDQVDKAYVKAVKYLLERDYRPVGENNLYMR